MKAVIMAGGEGTRLRPLTCDLPKPMVPIINKPVMEHIIELLKEHNITDIAVTLAYLPERIKEYFGDGRDWDVSLNYFVEDKPLGTAGSVKNAEDFLDEDFLVISGDALTDIDLTKAVQFHKDRQAMVTMVLKKVEIPLEYGVVVTKENGSIDRFLEKPSWGEVISDSVNTGIYILSPKIFQYYQKNEKFDFSKDLFPKILEDNGAMFGFVADGYWCDIGDIDAYAMANRDALNGKVKVKRNGFEFFKGVWIDSGCNVEEGALIGENTIIGRNCCISKNAKIEKNSIIGNNVTVNSGSSIKSGIIWDSTVLKENTEIRSSIICSEVIIEKGSRIFENSIVGSKSIINENVTVQPSVKIWPGKSIPSGMDVSRNIVFSNEIDENNNEKNRNLFGARGITGRVNRELYPENISRIGTSFGAALNAGAEICTAFDGSSGANMAKYAFESGACAQGSKIYDCGVLSLPILRFAIKEYSMAGGVFFTSENDVLKIILLDSNGCDINRSMERKIQSSYFRSDYVLSLPENIKNISRLEGIKQNYLSKLSKRSDKQYTIAVSGDENICKIAESIFERMGNKVVSFPADSFDLAVNFLDNLGEKPEIFDEMGREIKDDTLSLIISLVLFETYDQCTMVVPVSESSILEKLAEDYMAKITRAGISPRDIMEKLAKNFMQESSAAQFRMRYDAIACVIGILNYMAQNNCTLSSLKNRIPELNLERRFVDCAFKDKGKVMRSIIEESAGMNVETIDGIKIYNEKGWVLVLPDSEKPVCNIVTESFDTEFAQELADIYTDKINKLLLN